MAQVTLTAGGQLFPVGTTVSAYKQSNWSVAQLPPNGSAPQGSADGSGVVAADGSLVIAGLADATPYFAYALVGGSHNYRSFSTPVAPDARVSDYVTQPDHHGLKAWTFDPAVADTNVQLTSGVLQLARIYLPTNAVVSKLIVNLDVIGATLTAGQSFAGLYSAAGVLIAKSADQSAVFAGTVGEKQITLVAEAGQSLSLQGGDDVSFIGALLSVGTTTPRFTSGNAGSGMSNINRSGATLRFATVLAGQTALPASITPANMAAARSTWMGLV